MVKKVQKNKLKENKAKKVKKKGISLIALVVTIIVLLILAGIAIIATFGENGLIAKTKQAEFETKKKEMETELKLLREEKYIDKKVANQEYTLEEYVEDINDDDNRGDKLTHKYVARLENGVVKVTSGEYSFDITKSEDSGENAEEVEIEDNVERTEFEIDSSEYSNKNKTYKNWLFISYEESNIDEAVMKKIYNSIKIEGIPKEEIKRTEYIFEVESFEDGRIIDKINEEDKNETNFKVSIFKSGKKILVGVKDHEKKILSYKHYGQTEGITIKMNTRDWYAHIKLTKWGDIFKEVPEEPKSGFKIDITSIEPVLPSVGWENDQRRKILINAKNTYLPDSMFMNLLNLNELTASGEYISESTLRRINSGLSELNVWDSREYTLSGINLSSFIRENNLWGIRTIRGDFINIVDYYEGIDFIRNMSEIYISGSDGEIRLRPDMFEYSSVQIGTRFFAGSTINNLPINLFRGSYIMERPRMFEGATIRGYKPTPEELFGRPVDISFEQLYAGARLID